MSKLGRIRALILAVIIGSVLWSVVLLAYFNKNSLRVADREAQFGPVCEVCTADQAELLWRRYNRSCSERLDPPLPRFAITLKSPSQPFNTSNEEFEVTRAAGRDANIIAKGFQGALRALDAACGAAPEFVRKTPAPRALPYRGLLLDISHVFLSVTELMRILEFASKEAGLNVIHLHITDNQCFGIELDSAPELAHQSRGACNRGGKVRGYYTKNELRDLSTVAASMGVVIMIELDIPGHAGAWKMSHPEHVVQDYLDPESGSMWQLLSTVLTELDDVLPVTPLRTELPLGLHLGGDEVSNSRAYRAFEAKLKNYRPRHIQTHNLRWEESLLVGGAGENDIVTVWKSYEMAGRILLEDVVAQGFKAINMCLSRLYLDAKFQPTVQAIGKFDAFRSGSQTPGRNGRVVGKDREHLVIGAAVSCWGECMTDLAKDLSGERAYADFWDLLREAGRNFWHTKRPSQRGT
ncbi:hypothetical protein FOZ62_014018 [Perkinsus olseni]|uniref:beta-N-acetylhexosaminidase n=1 Tax=Perkinsus olseni TaxID=32597 RepID=A0A7J6TJD3_PEROL|nr:hypothetical protein FOZ62_014018 [Perkinsus olseni]